MQSVMLPITAVLESLLSNVIHRAYSRCNRCSLLRTVRAHVVLLSGVVRICCEEGQRWKLSHGALTANFRAGCSSGLMTNSFVTNAVLIKRVVSC